MDNQPDTGMGQAMPPAHPFDIDGVRSRLEAGDGGYEVVHCLCRGSRSASTCWSRREPDRQQPHADDEAHVVLDGTGVLEIEEKQAELRQGSRRVRPGRGRAPLRSAYEHLAARRSSSAAEAARRPPCQPWGEALTRKEGASDPPARRRRGDRLARGATYTAISRRRRQRSRQRSGSCLSSEPKQGRRSGRQATGAATVADQLAACRHSLPNANQDAVRGVAQRPADREDPPNPIPASRSEADHDPETGRAGSPCTRRSGRS